MLIKKIKKPSIRHKRIEGDIFALPPQIKGFPLSQFKYETYRLIPYLYNGRIPCPLLKFQFQLMSPFRICHNAKISPTISSL